MVQITTGFYKLLLLSYIWYRARDDDDDGVMSFLNVIESLLSLPFFSCSCCKFVLHQEHDPAQVSP